MYPRVPAEHLEQVANKADLLAALDALGQGEAASSGAPALACRPGPRRLPELARFTAARSEYKDLRDEPFEICGTQRVDGQLEQTNTLDQFSDDFKPLIRNYEAPSAPCGYFSVANAMILARSLPKRKSLSRDELENALLLLRDQAVVSREVERQMAFVQQSRRAYVDANCFPTASEVRKYMSDWVANYEISDYVIAESARGVVPPSVHFLRYNQLPEIGEAKHEELARLEEERPFGATVRGTDKETCTLEPGATRFIVERFHPARALLRPEAWCAEWAEARAAGESAPPVFVVDVNGHFVAAAAVIVEAEAGGPGMPTLVVVNTTGGSYLHSPALAYAFDLAFGLPL